MNAPEQINTLRLSLKRPVEDHAQAIFDAYASDPEVTQYLTWKPHTETGQTIEYLRSVSTAWDEHTGFTWSIFKQADDQLIGMVDLRIDDFRAECGYVLAKPFWGHGYMTETLTEIRAIAFSLPAVQRLQLFCDIDNPASARVMEKAGFEKEGVLRKYIRHPNISDEARDCLCYACVR